MPSDVDVIAFPQLRRSVLAEAVPGDDAMPLRLGVPLFVGTLPGPLSRQRKNRVFAVCRLDGLVLRVFAEVTDQMDYLYVHDFFSCFCPCNWGTRKRVDTAPKASGCFLGGTQKIFCAVSEDLLGGTGKAEDAKLPGAGIIPKKCPMERVRTETMYLSGFARC